MISDNQLEENVYGVSLYYQASPTVSGNTITGNTDGIYLSNASPNVSGNTIANNSQYGINLYSGMPSITGNTISANGQHGIYGATDGAEAVIAGNTVSSNGENAISITANGIKGIGDNHGSGNGGDYVEIREGAVLTSGTLSKRTR